MRGKADIIQSIREFVDQNTGTEEIERILWEKFGDECAVVVIDSKGFTRISKERGIVHFLVALLKTEKIVRHVFQSNGCQEFRLAADNMYAEFQTTDQALKAAIFANEALARKKIPLTMDENFQICTGIGFGRVLRSVSRGAYGNEMNLASKLGEDIAESGEIFLTSAAFSNLRNKDGLRFDKRLMNVSGVSVPYYAVIYK